MALPKPYQAVEKWFREKKKELEDNGDYDYDYND